MQFVSHNSVCSELEEIKCSIPQRSILGPLFFIIYINDILNIVHAPKMVIYTDITSLFFSGENLAHLICYLSTNFT